MDIKFLFMMTIFKRWMTVIGLQAQWLKALVANPDNLNSVFKTHMVEGETQLHEAVP